LVAFIANAHEVFASAGRIGISDFREDLGENTIMFAVSAATLIAGVGIHKYRRWALALAAVLGVLMILEAAREWEMDPWDFHNFTIALPMAAIMIWALLPPTWTVFTQRI
jgi:hypothetical protein